MADQPKSRRQKEPLYDEELPYDQPPRAREYTNRSNPDECSLREKRFVELLVEGRHKEVAAHQAGYMKPKAAAARLLREPRVQLFRKQTEAASMHRVEVNIDAHIRRRFAIANLEITDFADYFTPPCRHCWGDNYEYQRTLAEMEKALYEYQRDRSKNKLPFDPRGGDGYDLNKLPNPDCPNCFGDGDVLNKRLVMKDFADLSHIARQAITGLKTKPDGTIDFMLDKAAANAEIAAIIKGMIDPSYTPDGSSRVIGLRRAVNAGEAQRMITRVEHVIIRPPPREAYETEAAELLDVTDNGDDEDEN